MKSWLAAMYILLGSATITGCNFSAGSNTDKTAKILNSPPFDILTDSISKFPADANLYLKRAALLSQKDLPDLAYPDFKKAWGLSGDEFTAISYTANLFMTGREADAIKLLKECLSKFPANKEFPRRLSEAYMQSGKSREALDQFNKLIKDDSSNFEALYEKGVLLAELKDTGSAIQSLERAYTLQPLQQVGIYLANLYAETKNKRVLALCDELISKDSAHELTDAVFIKGIYFANIHQSDQALEQFDDCINRDWKFTEAYIEKGIILFKDNNFDEALKTFALAARVSNTYPDAYYWMGRCYESIGKIKEARDNYLRALALDKNFAEAKHALRRINND